ncbi:MAG: LysR family transcriptional regulator [Blastopirellula sp.]|nr:MAG: LysR family transcriptional regulator [Blastopirellula sp.]
MDSKQKILSVDFAALRTMQFVYELGSFSRTAEKLGQTQSNVSYTIARLRDCFDDPLFVRAGAEMIPTERCRAIVLQTSRMLEDIQSVAFETDFSAATARGQVTISCNHYERVTILPSFIRTLRDRAPGIVLRVINSHARGEEQLKRGECDLLIGPVQFFGDKVYKRHVRTDQYCCIMDRENPLCETTMTLEDYEAVNHILIRFSGGWRPLYLSKFEANGINIAPTIELSEYGDIGGYIRGTDLVAIIPSLIADQLGDWVVRKKLPLDVPIEIDIFWTTRTHQSPLHKWIRSTIATASRSTSKR